MINANHLQSLVSNLTPVGWRLPFLICDKAEHAKRNLMQLVSLISTKKLLIVSEQVPEPIFGNLPEQTNQASHIQRIKAKQYPHYLGHEFDHLIYDGFSGFHPDAVAALSGTIKAGGLLIILLPELDKLPQFIDPDLTRFVPHPYDAKKLSSHFLLHLTKHIEQSQQQAFVSSEHTLIPALPTKSTFCLPTQATQEQQVIINKIKNLANADALLITANRGRGKSAVMGMAATLLLESDFKIAFTAPRPGCLQSAKTWFTEDFPFIAPDALLNTKQTFDFLLIDEAAAIPTRLLQAFSQKASRLIIATTEHGYEGCGRGFRMRFVPWLNQQKRLQQVELKQPIRWAEADPLERWVNQLFLLNETELTTPTQPHQIAQQTIDIRWYSAAALVNNLVLLKQVFHLLVQAHYQTSVSDLRYLLDSPSMRCAVMTNKDHVLSVLLISSEGGLDAELAQQIFFGKRRPKGHLFAQTICAQSGLPEFASLTGYRVVRIAVQPEHQQQQLGSKLLDWLSDQAKSNNLDYVATSFGATESLIRFWNQNQYQLVRLGLTAETSTAEYSAAMLRPISTRCNPIHQDLIAQSQPSLLDKLATYYKDLPIPLIEALLKASAYRQTKLTPTQTQQVIAFTHHSASFDMARSAIKLTLLNRLDWLKKDATSTLLIGAVFLQWSNEEMVERLQLRGKKAAQQALRAAVKSLLVE